MTDNEPIGICALWDLLKHHRSKFPNGIASEDVTRIKLYKEKPEFVVSE